MSKPATIDEYITAAPPRALLARMIAFRIREHEDDGVNWM